jgi:hypothetical protein
VMAGSNGSSVVQAPQRQAQARAASRLPTRNEKNEHNEIQRDTTSTTSAETLQKMKRSAARNILTARSARSSSHNPSSIFNHEIHAQTVRIQTSDLCLCHIVTLFPGKICSYCSCFVLQFLCSVVSLIIRLYIL